MPDASSTTTTNHAGLRWAIKRSFQDYVRRLPDGQAAFDENVTATDGGELVWTTASTSTTEGATQTIKFAGELRFGGYRGLLFVRVCDPWLEIQGTSGVLTVADPQLTDESLRVPLVTFSVDAQDLSAGTWTGHDVRLTAEGVDIFNNVYKVNEEFDPFHVSIDAN